MITTTKTSIDSTKNGIDLSKKSSSIFSNKSASELKSTNDKNRSSRYESNKKDDFKNVLNSKVNSGTEDAKKTENYDKVDESKSNEDLKSIEELKDKLNKDSKELSKDDISEILSSILNLLNKLGVNENSLDSKENINSDILKIIMEGTDNVKSSNNDLSALMSQLLEALKKDSAQKELDTNSLDLVQKLLNQLSEKLDEDKTSLGNNVKSGIKDLMSEISKIIGDKQSQGDKVLSLEDMLKKDFSNQDSQSSLGDKENKESSIQTSKNNNEVSKEDKFLKSLLNDDKDNSLSKINLFAPRTQNTQQGQIINSNQQLAVNKATFADDLIKDVKFMATNSLKELTVKVNPGNLGEITIKLIQEDGIMKANLKANSKETTALLTQNLVDIKKQLGEQNIKIEHVNIELYQDDTTFFKQEHFGEQLQQEQGKNNKPSSGNNKSNTLENASEDGSIKTVDVIDNNNVNYLA